MILVARSCPLCIAVARSAECASSVMGKKASALLMMRAMRACSRSNENRLMLRRVAAA